jgi:HAD superfamily hydrolase (TIGR01549 family)
VTVRVVLFDVDYTLIKPGPVFDLDGYIRNGRRFGLTLDPERWPRAQRAAWAIVEERRAGGHAHDMALIPAVTHAVVGALAGDDTCHAAADACEALAQHQAAQWWDLANYSLFDDVLPCLERLHDARLAVGLVSNTERDLDAAVAHFGLGQYVGVTVASAQVGLMKPEPEIFLVALRALDALPADAAMVGDNVYDDVKGALDCGFALAVLLDRRGRQRRLAERGEPIHAPAIESLADLPALLGI